MKERNRELDILRGIGILLMIFDHADFGDTLHIFIQSFHMPLFFIVSGYLWKDRPVGKVLTIRFRTLLIPYFFFSFLYFCLSLVAFRRDQFNALVTFKTIFLYPTDLHNRSWFGALWFLPCMFLTNVVYTILGKCKFFYKAIGVFIITTFGAIWSSTSNVMLPLCLEPFAAALLFMLIGETIHKYGLNDRVFSFKFSTLLLLACWAVLAFLNKSVDMRSARLNTVPLYFLNGFLGTLAFWDISRWINSLRFRNVSKIQKSLQFVGKYSIVYLCIHQFPLWILKHNVSYYLSDNPIIRILYRCIMFILPVILCSIIAMLVARWKPLKSIFGIQSNR